MHKLFVVASLLALSALSVPRVCAQRVDPSQKGLLQSVQLLEMKLFGRTFFGEPIVSRIDRLEDVVGVPHRKDKGSLARVDIVEKQIPHTPEERHKAAERAIEAENEQVSDKMWHDLSVIGVGVKVVDLKIMWSPPAVHGEEMDRQRSEQRFREDLERACSAALGSALAHSLGSVVVGTQLRITCTVADSYFGLQIDGPSQSKEFDQSAKTALENLAKRHLLPIPAAARNATATISITLQTVKTPEAQSEQL
jgi:hypothetical protein